MFCFSFRGAGQSLTRPLEPRNTQRKLCWSFWIWSNESTAENIDLPSHSGDFLQRLLEQEVNLKQNYPVSEQRATNILPIVPPSLVARTFAAELHGASAMIHETFHFSDSLELFAWPMKNGRQSQSN